ncbi:hypothetical protein N9018_02360 [Rhodopirellula sp.]|nr:hypothetical protein [Rhodopirellula sp.]
MSILSRRDLLSAVSLSILALPTVALAERQAEVAAIKAGLFEAMDAGQIDVKIIPQNATKANVLIRNLTDKPVELRLPKAFASVPILAQGMMGGMGGMGGGGMGMGLQRIAPEKMQKLTVTMVCLEHGKKDPNPRMAYKMVPIEQFTQKADVRVLCEALGYGQVTQNTAQAAAWHMMDGLSWNELAAKNRVESKYLGNIRWFSPFELRTAMAVAKEADRLAKQRAKTNGKTTGQPEKSQSDFEG